MRRARVEPEFLTLVGGEDARDRAQRRDVEDVEVQGNGRIVLHGELHERVVPHARGCRMATDAVVTQIEVHA